MIRNVVLFSVKEGTRPEQLDAIVRAMKAVRFELPGWTFLPRPCDRLISGASPEPM